MINTVGKVSTSYSFNAKGFVYGNRFLLQRASLVLFFHVNGMSPVVCLCFCFGGHRRCSLDSWLMASCVTQSTCTGINYMNYWRYIPATIASSSRGMYCSTTILKVVYHPFGSIRILSMMIDISSISDLTYIAILFVAVGEKRCHTCFRCLQLGLQVLALLKRQLQGLRKLALHFFDEGRVRGFCGAPTTFFLTPFFK